MKKTKKCNLFVILFLLLISNSQAQDAGDHIFDQSTLHEVRIEFQQANFLAIMESNFESTPEGESVPYLMGNVTIDGELVDSVGVRFKGFTSYVEGDKKPIKIDFNEFVSGKKYDGLRKLNLNNGTGDASMQRDVVCYDLMRHTGVKAPRTSYSKVFFNDVYWGLYQNIEQVDKTFLNRNFSNPKGNLFKNKGWSHFEWNGPNPTSYYPPFELKTNEDGNDWSGFVNLMDIINNSSDTEFPTVIEEVFNVDLFLKTLAVDVATNNWDSYLEHGRNWYIYEDTATNIFHWIPWDYNFALGGGAFGGGGPTDECLVFVDFLGLTDGTTTVNFTDLSFYVGTAEFLWTFGDGETSTEQNPEHTYDAAGVYDVCLTISTASTCSEQTCYQINTNDNPADCQSIVNGTCPHPPDFTFALVINWFPFCCDTWGEDCEDFYGQFGGGGLGGTFEINQQENEGVLIQRLLNVPEFNNRYYTYFCDLMNYQMTEEHLFELIDQNETLITDAVEDDPNFLFSFEEYQDDVGITNDTLGLKGILSNRIEELQEQLVELITCPSYVSSIAVDDVAINEFVASTDETYTITDPAGEREDWIEFYNNTSSNVDLTGVYFSDDMSDLQKWQFPTGTEIPADAYLIVWADKDEDQEGLHANFKLNNSGEQLVLSNSDGSIIDSLTFGEQMANVSAARIPNGTGDFVFQGATHGFNNEDVSGVFDLNNNLNVSVYPVPASTFLEINIQGQYSTDFKIEVFTLTGQLLLEENKKATSFRLDVNDWNDGFYILKIRDNKGNTNSLKIVIAK